MVARLFPHSQDLITQTLSESPTEHSSRYPSVHSLLHPFPDSPTHPLSIHLTTHPSIHPSTHPSSHSSSHPSTCPPTLSTQPYTHLFTKPSVLHMHPPTHSFTHSSFYPCIHPPNHPPTEQLVNSPIHASISLTRADIGPCVPGAVPDISLCFRFLVCKIGIKLRSTGLRNLGGKGWSPRRDAQRVREAWASRCGLLQAVEEMQAGCPGRRALSLSRGGLTPGSSLHPHQDRPPLDHC